MSDPNEEEQAEVFDFLSDYLDDLERGRRRPLREYLDRHPGHEAVIAREWLQRVEQGAGPQLGEQGEEQGARTIGPYVLVRELGRGGQGTVWLAEDTRIARRVALKLLDAGAISSERRARLRREAETVARLDHPGICHVYEAVVDGGTPYIAMRHVEGEAMARSLARAREGAGRAPIPWVPRDRSELERVLRLFERAARALHAAHEAGVVHRDVKPGNLMITPEGEPVLLDFGLARDEEALDERITLSGELFGTPGYTSPEQLGMAELDRRTDLWSLGVALYEALTGERPFEAGSRFELETAIMKHAPANARAKNPVVTAETWVVLQTALEKERGRRYTTALGLAEDLRRICEYEPIHARPAGALLRLRRWMQRQPLVASAVIGTITALSIALAINLNTLAKLRRQNVISHGRHLAERAIENVDRDPGLALLLAIEAAEASPTHLGRSALFTTLDACRLERVIVSPLAHRFLDLEIRTDTGGDLVLAGAPDDGTARLWELPSGYERARFDHAGETVLRVLLNSDASRLVTGSERVVETDGKSDGVTGVVRCFRAPDPSPVWSLEPAAAPILWMEARPDRDSLIVLAAEGGAWLLGIADGEILAHFDVPVGEADRVSFSPDGSRLLFTSSGSPIEPHTSSPIGRVFNVESGELSFELVGHQQSITWGEWGPGGAVIVTASRDGTARLWDATRGAALGQPFQHEDPVTCATFSPDGGRLATTTSGGVAALWSCETGRRIELVGHGQRPVVHASFSPDGTRLATASNDLSTRIWDVATGEPTHVLRSLYLPLESIWTPDGKRLITRSKAPRVHQWCLSNLPFVYPLRGHRQEVLHVEFDAQGERALSASADGSVRIWHTPPGVLAPVDGTQLEGEPGQCTLVFDRHQGPVPKASFVLGGEAILSISEDATARLFDAADGTERVRPMQHETSLEDFAVSQAVDRLVTLDEGGTAWLWSLSEGRSLGRIEEQVEGLGFSPDGRRLALVIEDDGLLLCDASDGSSLRKLRPKGAATGSQHVRAFAFRPDGREVALATGDSHLSFFDPDDGRATRQRLQSLHAVRLEYDPTGSLLLASGEGYGSLLVLDVASGEKREPVVLHKDALTHAAFDSSGRLFLSSSRDGSVFLWSTASARPLIERPGQAPVLCAAFGPDLENPTIVAGYGDGSCAVFPADPLPAARARRPRELERWEREMEKRLADPLPER